MQGKQVILAVETAIRTGSISIIEDGRGIVSVKCQSAVSRSIDLLQVISVSLASVRLNLTSIDLIAVSTGPGSFNGVRVGIATAQALAFGLGCDLVGISVFDALKGYAGKGKKIIIILPAGRNLFFWRKTDNQSNYDKTLDCIGTPAELSRDISRSHLECEEIISEFGIGQEIENILSTITGIKIKPIIASDNISSLIAQATLKEVQIKKALAPLYVREAIQERIK
jgi:tRNA threonylcarbamoyl adenosine modification protein YeaZ